MTARSLTLTTIFAALLVASGAGALDPPTAPLPRPAGEKAAGKTTAELLVGTWKRVKQQDNPLPPDWDITIEFTAGGKVIMRAKGPFTDPPPLLTGTYKLEGNTIRVTMDMDPLPNPPSRTPIIKFISEEKLMIAGPKGTPRSEYRRLPPKK